MPERVPAQVRLPLVLVTVQPLTPEPPASKTSPVEEPAMETVPEVPASMVRLVAAVETAMAGAAPVKLRLPPREVKLAPETVKVLSRVVAPCKVRVPGVVVEPIVLMEESPEPKVLVVPAPVAKVVLPEEVKVEKAPVDAEVAPMAVELMPVAVVLKLPEVKVMLLAPVLIEEAPRSERVKAPEVPVMLTAPVVTVRPLAKVPSPAWVTVKLVEVIRLVAKVPERLMPLLILSPVILRASVTVIWLPVAVSLLARASKESTVLSVETTSIRDRLILAAVSLLPAIEVNWENWTSKPTIEPVETAVVLWVLVMLNWLACQAVSAAELVVEVKLVSWPVVKEASVIARAVPVVVVEVKLEVLKPVKAIEPEVPVMLTAPVVTVKPLEAVNKAAEVMVPVEVVLMLPLVVMASPALVGWRTLGPVVLSHQP